jgi:hypothetical protein
MLEKLELFHKLKNLRILLTQIRNKVQNLFLNPFHAPNPVPSPLHLTFNPDSPSGGNYLHLTQQFR